MFIKKYDLYDFQYRKQYLMSFRFEDKDDIPYSITRFLKEIYPYDSAVWYKNHIEKIKGFDQIGIFQDVEITLDKINNIIYLSDASEDDYRFRTPNITSDIIIQMCNKEDLYYNVMTKDNFVALVSSWVELLKHEPKFVLLYLDDKDWYDVLPFETQETMEQFVADHTKQE